MVIAVSSRAAPRSFFLRFVRIVLLVRDDFRLLTFIPITLRRRFPPRLPARRRSGWPASPIPISCLASFGAAMSRPVPASVTASRRRLSATATARTPPATALKRNALITRAGPMMAPIAAISLTSPAPVAPSRCPGIISAKPTTSPRSEADKLRPLNPAAARVTPTPAIVAVSRLGMRRVRTSMTVAASAPAATATKAALDTGSNRRPENCLNRVADGGHRTDGEERDQGHEQAVPRAGPGPLPSG